MISEIRFKNYRLFKEENTISLVADARTKTLLSNASEIDNRNILKAISIYGANNSGKTNIYSLFSLIKDVLSGKIDLEFNRSIFSDDPITEISITYDNLDGLGWIRYEFSYDSIKRKYIKEKMVTITYYQKGKPFEKVIFEKDSINQRYLIFGKEEDSVLPYLPSSLPFLYSIDVDSVKFSELKIWQESLKKLSDSFLLVSMYNFPLEHTLEALKGEDEKKKRFINAFVKAADLSIEGFKYEKKISFLKEVKQIVEETLRKYSDSIDMFHLSTNYGGREVPSLLYDSSGTKKIEALASYVYEAIIEKKILIVDELDNGLHFRLTKAIVSSFNNMVNEYGQIIFTAHDLLLMDSKMLFRKEQIYFTHREKEGSVLLSLRDRTISMGGPREGSDLLRRYNKGEIERLPTPSFVKELIHFNDGRRSE